MRHNILPAQIHIVSLDLLALLILTQMSWAEPALCNEIQQNNTASPGKVFCIAGPHAGRKLPHCVATERYTSKVTK